MRTDFQKAFQPGYTFRYDSPCYTNQTVTISVAEIGSLALPSGKIVVQDVGYRTELRYCLQKTFAPGNYSVSLSLACFRPEDIYVIACAKVQFSNVDPVKWEVARSDNIEYPAPTYDVDSGCACFIDFETAWFLNQTVYPNYSTDLVHPVHGFYQPGSEEYILDFAFFADEVRDKMDENGKALAERLSCQFTLNSWANLFLNEMTSFEEVSDRNIRRVPDTNIVVFSSGWGDGDFSSYWGLDENDQICCLVTDFFIFFEKYPEYRELYKCPDIVCDDGN